LTVSTQLNISLRQLRAFAEAYRLRNLTHAADALHITQSAVSALIRQLEGSLNVQLFERTPRTLRPTKAADDAYVQVEGILGRIGALQQSMHNRAETGCSTLSFSCAPALASACVPTVLAKFQRAFPDVQTVMYDADGASLIQRVLDENAEFSIGFFGHEPVAVTREPLVVDYLNLVCHKDSPLASKDEVQWTDLLDQQIINLSKSEILQHLISESLAGAGSAYRPAYEIGFIYTALAMASQGLGVVVAPGFLIKGNPHVANLVARKLHNPVIERTLFIHTREGHVLSAVGTEFVDMLRAHLLALESPSNGPRLD
jgi:LysR family transcriptional regulator, carnitine catabolism transcriptional activator